MENQSPTSKPNAGQAMGITSLVLGIITIPFALFPCTSTFSIVPAILAIIFGAVGLNQAKKGNAGTGLPIAGLVLGILCAIFSAYWTYTLVQGAKEGFKNLQNDTSFQKLDSLMRQQMDSTMNKPDSIQ